MYASAPPPAATSSSAAAIPAAAAGAITPPRLRLPQPLPLWLLLADADRALGWVEARDGVVECCSHAMV